jgi:hypothetical protein
VKPLTRRPCPAEFVTTTSTEAPGVPAGVEHVKVVSSTTTTFVAGLPPMRTVLTSSSLKLRPVSVTVVPPMKGPAPGTTAVTPTTV